MSLEHQRIAVELALDPDGCRALLVRLQPLPEWATARGASAKEFALANEIAWTTIKAAPLPPEIFQKAVTYLGLSTPPEEMSRTDTQRATG